MSTERFFKKTVPFLAVISVACLPEPEVTSCPINVTIQAQHYRNSDQISVYDNEDFDTSRIIGAAQKQELELGFFGSPKEFTITTDEQGKAQFSLDLVKEEITPKNIYLMISRKEDQPSNIRLICGMSKDLRVLLPDQRQTNSLPTPTRVPLPTITPRPINTPTPEARRTPIPAPTPDRGSNRVRQYPQCGGTCYSPRDNRVLTFPGNNTVMVTESIDSQGNKTYSCSTLGAISGQCNNP